MDFKHKIKSNSVHQKDAVAFFKQLLLSKCGPQAAPSESSVCSK